MALRDNVRFLFLAAARMKMTAPIAQQGYLKRW